MMAGQAAKKAAAARPAAAETNEAGKPAETNDEGVVEQGQQTAAPVDADRAAELAEQPLGEGTANAAAGEDSVTVTASDEIGSDVYETADENGDQFVTITKDVVEEFYYPGTKRPAQRILFTKGQVVRKSYIDALNARVQGSQAVTSDEAAR